MPLRTIDPNLTCACCGQPVARERRQSLMVDQALLEACNSAFERATLESSAFVEIAHLVRCLVPHLDERDVSLRFGMTLRSLDDAARYWLLQNARSAAGALRTSDDLKGLLQRAEMAAKAHGRAFASAMDVLDVLWGKASDLVTSRFVSFGRSSDSAERFAAAPAPRRQAHSADAYGLRSDDGERWASPADGWLSTTRLRSSGETWTASHASAGLRRQEFNAPDQRVARPASAVAPSIDPRDQAIESLTKQLRAHEQQITQLLAQSRETERERARSRESARHHGDAREWSRNPQRFERADRPDVPSAACAFPNGALSALPRRDSDVMTRARFDQDLGQQQSSMRGARKGMRRWALRKRIVWTRRLHSLPGRDAWAPTRDRYGDDTRIGSRVPLSVVRSHTPRQRAIETDDLADAPAHFSEPEDHIGSIDEASKRFYLSLDDPIVRAPSIGQKTAAKLEAVGLWTIRDLLQQNPAAIAEKLAQRFFTAQRIADWQAQSRLVCIIPWLRGTHAQLLVGAGYRRLDQIVDADAGVLCAAILRFAGTRDGQSVLRTQPPPDSERIARWVQHASLAEASRAA